jgi:hypothetical protein
MLRIKKSRSKKKFHGNQRTKQGRAVDDKNFVVDFSESEVPSSCTDNSVIPQSFYSVKEKLLISEEY